MKKTWRNTPITDEQFDAMLESLLDEMSGAELLLIPGVYEAVSEYLNNDVLAEIRRAREEDA